MAEVQMERTSLDDLPDNRLTKKDEIKVEPVVHSERKGKLEVEKPSVIKRAVNAFVGHDVGDVKSFILFDVVIPAAKNLLSDIIVKGSNMILFGDGKAPGGVKREGNRSYVSYNAYSDRNRRWSNDRPPWDEPDTRRSYTRGNSSRFNPNDYKFEYREDAEQLMADILDYLEDAPYLTIAQFKEMISTDEQPIKPEYTDYRYGWERLNGIMNVERIRDWWILNLPTPRVIRN